VDKQSLYRRLQRQIASLHGEADDAISVMANTVAALHEALACASWTGFYRVVAPDLLRVGPFQGPVACVEIPFGRGVCGAAAETLRTQVVPDVHAFPGHIACDARARSEIVVPVLDVQRRLVAVLDIDSHQPASFDEEDRVGLESIVAVLAGPLTAPPT
jgi:GAF domain-containing protein